MHDHTKAMFWHPELGLQVIRVEGGEVESYSFARTTAAEANDPDYVQMLVRTLDATIGTGVLYVYCPDIKCTSCGEVFDEALPEGTEVVDCPACGYPVGVDNPRDAGLEEG